MLGLGATVQVKGEGMVKWEFRDDYGVKQVIEVKGYYIPTSKVRLFSPQSYFKQEKGGSYTLAAEGSVFTFASGKHLVFAYMHMSHLPIVRAKYHSPMQSGYLSLPSQGRLNISKGQEELLLWHSILGHYDIARIQSMITNHTITPTHKGARTCVLPLC